VITAAYIVLFSAGCGTDTPGLPGGVTLPPVITLNSGAGLVSFNQELPLSSPSFTVNVSGEDGDAALRDLAVLENGTTIPPGQLVFQTGQTANNPILTAGADANGFNYIIDITPSNVAAGDVTFSFRLTDTDGETASTQVTITYTVAAPTVDLLIEDGFVSGDVAIESRYPSFNVKLRYDDTADSVASITVLEDGVIMAADALTYNEGTITASNPLDLIAGERSGGTFDINVDPDIAVDGSRTYTFRVTDVNGVSAERSVVVTYVISAGTATTFAMEGVFFNASGMMRGGLDLDNGTAVTFNSSEAEIEDEGVNLDLSTAEKWRAQISATNDAELRIANLAAVIGDGVTFESINVMEDIAEAFDKGEAELGGDDDVPDTDGDLSNDEIVTTQLQGGEVFAVRRGNRIYLVRIDAINFVANSNNDSYTVSIKY
jgi:hypothetical protein